MSRLNDLLVMLEPLGKMRQVPSKERETWPWILMAGPAIAVIGCIITIILAVQNFSDQAIDDGGVKSGLVVSKQTKEH